MPKFDDSDEEQADNRDTVKVGNNADAKFFENVEEMLQMQEEGKEMEFEEAKTTLEAILNSSTSSEKAGRMSRRQSKKPALTEVINDKPGLEAAQQQHQDPLDAYELLSRDRL